MTQAKAESTVAAMVPLRRIGFVGLGVMGGAMCRNIIRRQRFERVLLLDQSTEAVDRVLAVGGRQAQNLAELAGDSDAIVLSLPDGAASVLIVEQLLPHLQQDQLIIDTSTIPVRVARELATRCAHAGAHYLDAPVARTRDAAEAGTLSVMVGGSLAGYERAQPLLSCIASDITFCGASGHGQVYKILNNMVLFQTVNALAEALAIGERAGVDTQQLFTAFTKGSADSFALRNHGMKALLPRQFPERAFSTLYARKDNACALELADELAIEARGARLIDEVFGAAIARGLGEHYFPSLVNLLL